MAARADATDLVEEGEENEEKQEKRKKKEERRKKQKATRKESFKKMEGEKRECGIIQIIFLKNPCTICDKYIYFFFFSFSC